MSAIRPAAVAGAFYPAVAGELERQIGALIAGARRGSSGPVPKAIIAPHAGYIYSGPVAAPAYARLAAARGRIERVALLGPSHHVGFPGFAVGTATAWQSPLGRVAVDRAAVDRLIAANLVQVLDAAHDREHALEVQVPFLQAVLGDFRLVPIVAGAAAPATVAALIDALWGGPETLIVVSTDLSHYLDYRACQQSDERTAQAIESYDEGALGPNSACGRVPVGGLLVAAKRRGMRIERLNLRNSGDTAGPRDRVVGYGSWALFEPALAGLGPGLIELACLSIATGLTTGQPKAVTIGPGLSAALRAPGAVFVTLKRAGRLRGCMGSAVAHRPLVADVLDNAFKAAFRDPRFPPLQLAELEGLNLSIAILTPPVAMRFDGETSLLAQLRPGIDGLIIEDQRKSALFLPAVWQALPDRRQFLTQLKLKAGLGADHWSASFQARRFETEEIEDAAAGEPDLLRRLLGLAARSPALGGAVRLRPPDA